MPKSNSKTKTDNAWNNRNYWFPRIFFKKELEPEIREIAKGYGSVNAFITSAVMEKIEQLKTNEK